jgi:hypothetical protein
MYGASDLSRIGTSNPATNGPDGGAGKQEYYGTYRI